MRVFKVHACVYLCVLMCGVVTHVLLYFPPSNFPVSRGGKREVWAWLQQHKDPAVSVYQLADEMVNAGLIPVVHIYLLQLEQMVARDNMVGRFGKFLEKTHFAPHWHSGALACETLVSDTV